MVVPRELVDQFCKRRAVLFVGAGVSRTAGLPNWQELVEPLKRDLGDCPEDATPIDIAQFFLTATRRRRLAEIVRSKLPPNVNPTEAHRLIATLPLYRIFTTNLDSLLETACERTNVAYQVIYNTGTLETAEEGKLAIIKLHGHLAEPESIVLATEDYDEYLDRNPDLSDELRYVLRRQTVLFVGYSFNDPNIKAIFRTVQRASGRLARNHYVLLTSPHHLVRAELERRGLLVISLPGETDQTTELIKWLRQLAMEIRSREPFRTKTKLPTSPEDLRLIGRDEERQTVLDALSKRRVVVIHGPPGVGKTSLAIDVAIEWARQGGPKDLEHVVWLSATDYSGQPYNLNDLLDAIGNAVDNPVVEQTTIPAKKRSYVQGILARPTLLIIDNFDVRSDSDIFDWLGKESHPAHILICSQDSTQGKLKNAYEIQLQGLQPADAIELVKRLGGELIPLLEASDQGLPRFVFSCLRNPRALELAVALMQSRHFNLETIALDVRSCENNVEKIIEKLHGNAMQILTRPALQVLRCAAMFQVNDLSEEALLFGSGLAETEFRGGLDQLVRFRLIESLGKRRYAVHQKLRALARSRDPEFWSDHEAFRRCAKYYCNSVRTIVARPGLPRYWNSLVSKSMQEIDREWPIIRELMKWAEREKNKILIDFVFLLVHYMDSRFYSEDRMIYVKAAIDMLKNDSGRKADLALLKIDALGWTLVERNRPDIRSTKNREGAENPEQVITEGYDIAATLPADQRYEDKDLMALALAWRARLEMQRRNLDKAEEHITNVSSLAAQCSPWIQMRIEMVAGDLALYRDDAKSALEHYNNAESVTKGYGGEGDGYQIQPRIGMVYVKTEPARAKEIFEKLREASAVPIANLYGAYGVALAVKHMGDEDEARRLVERADLELQTKTEPNHLIDWLRSKVVEEELETPSETARSAILRPALPRPARSGLKSPS